MDTIIKNKLNNWDITRLAAIDKAILRMSISEMLFIDEIPPKVSITEGVEIAKEFSTDDSSSFVNGIFAQYCIAVQSNSVSYLHTGTAKLLRETNRFSVHFESYIF